MCICMILCSVTTNGSKETKQNIKIKKTFYGIVMF